MTRITWHAVAASQKSDQLFSNVLPWVILLLGVVLAGGIVIYLIRRLLKDERSAAQVGFTLQDLRQMHAAGQLSDHEFERAKAMMIGRLAGTSDPDKHQSSTGNHEQSTE